MIIQKITSLACYFGISRAVCFRILCEGFSHIIWKEGVIEELDSRLKINSNMLFQMNCFVFKRALFTLQIIFKTLKRQTSNKTFSMFFFIMNTALKFTLVFWVEV